MSRPDLRSLSAHRHLLGQILRFCVTSGISAGITVGLPVVLHEGLRVTPPVATAIAFTVAFVVNFFALRRIVFRSRQGIGRDFMTFAGSSLVFRLLEYLAFLLLNLVLGVHYVVALLLVLTISTVSKFFWYRKVLGGQVDPLAGRG